MCTVYQKLEKNLEFVNFPLRLLGGVAPLSAGIIRPLINEGVIPSTKTGGRRLTRYQSVSLGSGTHDWHRILEKVA